MNIDSSQASERTPLLPSSSHSTVDMGTEQEAGSITKHDGSIQEVDNASGENVQIEGRLLLDHERKVAEKKLIRKLDSRLMPTIFIIYIMNYVSPPAHDNACLIRLRSMYVDFG